MSERGDDYGFDFDEATKFKLTRFGDVTLDTGVAYLVKGMIPSRGLTVVWGPPKCGKSFLTFDVMMSVALGTPAAYSKAASSTWRSRAAKASAAASKPTNDTTASPTHRST
jgi:hypothetical protein